jgi:hypothetical protein
MLKLASIREVALTTTCSQSLQKSKHGQHKKDYFAFYYQKNKQKYLLAQQKYRTKLKANKPVKSHSLFSINRQKNLLSCLNKHHITVPVPRFLKIKHPIIQG